jgi:multiple sugar transport system permease protein
MSLAAPAKARTGRVADAPSPRAARRRNAIVVFLVLIAVAFVMLTPFIWTAMAATKSTAEAFSNPPVFFYQPSFDSFALVVGAPAAYALSRYGGQMGALLLVLALVFRALPRFAVALPFYNFAQALGIYDTKIALMIGLVALNQPFTIWLLRNFFMEIPKELDEAAMVDGCNRFQTLTRVILPIMGPGLVTAGIFTFLFAFQEYLLALVLTNTDAKTIPLFIATQIGQNLPLLQQASAATVLVALPILVLAMVVQRFLVAGLTGGSVKG